VCHTRSTADQLKKKKQNLEYFGSAESPQSQTYQKPTPTLGSGKSRAHTSEYKEPHIKQSKPRSHSQQHKTQNKWFNILTPTKLSLFPLRQGDITQVNGGNRYALIGGTDPSTYDNTYANTGDSVCGVEALTHTHNSEKRTKGGQATDIYPAVLEKETVIQEKESLSVHCKYPLCGNTLTAIRTAFITAAATCSTNDFSETQRNE
jgi:hypothetical protein